MTTCVPIRDLKDTTRFSALVEEAGEVVVTKDGSDAFHCMSANRYEHVEEQLARARLLQRLVLADEETKSGKYSPFDEFVQTL